MGWIFHALCWLTFSVSLDENSMDASGVQECLGLIEDVDLGGGDKTSFQSWLEIGNSP